MTKFKQRFFKFIIFLAFCQWASPIVNANAAEQEQSSAAVESAKLQSPDQPSPQHNPRTGKKLIFLERPKPENEEVLTLFVEATTPYRIYANKIKIKGQAGPGVKLQVAPEDKIEVATDGQFTWTVYNLKKNQSHDLPIHAEVNDDTSLSLFKLYRQSPRLIQAGVGAISTPEGKSVYLGHTQFEWWMDKSFLRRYREWDFQRWGMSARIVDTLKKESSSIATPDLMQNYAINYRLNPGLNDVDSSLVAALSYQEVRVDGVSAQVVGISIKYLFGLPTLIDNWFNKNTFIYKSKLGINLSTHFLPIKSEYNIDKNQTFEAWIRVYLSSYIFLLGEMSFNDLVYDDSVRGANLDMKTGYIGMGLVF